MGNITSTIDYIHQNTNNHDEEFLKNLLNKSVEKVMFPLELLSSNDIASPDFHLEYTDSTDKISYVVIKSLYPSDKYIIWSHSSRSNIASDYYYLKMVSLENDVNIILYDYIGYGKTMPNTLPCEESCYYSLKTIINHCRNKKNIPKEKLFLVGYEMGCAVTIKYVSTVNWDEPIMLINPFKSVGDLVIHHIYDHIKINGYDENIIKKHIPYFNIYRKLNDVRCPVKIVHDNNNQFIPVSHAIEIYKKILNNSSKNMIHPLSSTILDCNNNNIMLMLSERIMNDILEYQTINYNINHENYQQVLNIL